MFGQRMSFLLIHLHMVFMCKCLNKMFCTVTNKIIKRNWKTLLLFHATTESLTSQMFSALQSLLEKTIASQSSEYNRSIIVERKHLKLFLSFYVVNRNNIDIIENSKKEDNITFNFKIQKRNWEKCFVNCI